MLKNTGKTLELQACQPETAICLLTGHCMCCITGKPDGCFLTGEQMFSIIVFMKLTRREKDVFDFIRRFHERHGVPPSIREICSGLGLKSPGSMHKVIISLERKGFVEKNAGKGRTLKVKGAVVQGFIPLLGRIAAGIPVEAQENLEEELPVDPRLFGTDECLALTVKGDSMTGVAIQPGDIAVIRPQETVNDGEIAAVMVEGILDEAVLKIVRIRNGTIELHSANPDYEPMCFEGEKRKELRIIGRFIGLIRRP
ncbi:MAG TPA: repressor LexA [Thermodesulfobacteriaceae bacterium]|nr:repressor LexA [Thermodesulfobacteriaceae bacterium]